MLEKIISGGQTGVDQAALYVANELRIPVGGWCPKDGLDENNVSILKKYPLVAIDQLSLQESINERTRRNIRDSDGTLIIVPKIPLPASIKDGTLLTLEHAKLMKKPYLIIEVNKYKDITAKVLEWTEENNIRTLNIAGPRESTCPGIYEESCKLLQFIFSNLKPRPKL